MRRYILPLLSVVLVGTGAGLLLSPSSDPVLLTQTQVATNQPVTTLISQPTTNQSPTYAPPTQLNISVKPGDSLSAIFQSHGLDAAQSYQLLQTEHGALLNKLQPGQEIEIRYTQRDNHVHQLILRSGDATETHFSFQDNGCHSKQIALAVESNKDYREVSISRSLQQDAQAAGLSAATIQTISQILASEIDFALDLRTGDHLAVLLNRHTRNGKTVSSPTIEALAFFNNGRYFEAFRFEGESNTYYLTADGLSLQRRFLRAPLDYRRVSSRFNPNRLHPIFKTQRPHNGIDYAAPEGIPVLAAGSGRISFIGEQKGYGNVVIVDHGQSYSTLYAHLSGFAAGLQAGDDVSQGDEIAYVGQTGWATGPHLHYEFRIHGQHKNPSTVTIPYDAPLSKQELMTFLQQVAGIKRDFTSRFSTQLKSKINR
ncbi:peptidase M23 [Maribrevibacterium harenarium]|uniref:Peptidase M23 n=1 Tax=Maribrevibacterium harenarium TaxID=2589817 RepID=A0A501X2T3_9GAMM|nr:peptidoglycan DD-metalloendopeptidase family protein [Maribrevibacterium harenarium]TPE54789.1 peptidase M23 [Maribrevibacterium harenarium]